MLRLPEVLQFISDYHTIRHKEPESRSLFIEGEEIHLPAYLPVVPLLGFLQPFQIFIQFLLARETGAVYPLKHLPVRIASPVGSRHALELDGLYLTRPVHVRPRAEVHEISLPVEGYDFILRQVFYQLHLVVFALVSHELYRFLSGQLKSLQRIVGLDYLLHLLLYLQKVLIVELMLHIEIVIEAVLDSRSYGQLGVRPELLHGLSHYVRRSMSVAQSHLLIFKVYLLLCHFFLSSFILICRLSQAPALSVRLSVYRKAVPTLPTAWDTY